MKILITGGAGFIGSHLAENFYNDNHEVFIVDNLSSGHRENINFIDDNRRCYDNDLSCCNNLRTREGQCSSCDNINARSGNNRSISNCCDEDNYNIGCGTLRSGDPNTTACRTCACQRQFRNCLRRV